MMALSIRPKYMFLALIFSGLNMLFGWGLVAGVAVLYLGERIPQIREDFFSRIPFLGNVLL